MRRLVSAWGWYVAGAVTVLLGLWLYARRLGFGLGTTADDEE